MCIVYKHMFCFKVFDCVNKKLRPFSCLTKIHFDDVTVGESSPKDAVFVAVSYV